MFSMAQQMLALNPLSEPRRRQSTRSVHLLSIWAIGLSISVALAPVAAQEAWPPSVEQGQAATLSYGGRLYDNHWVVLNVLPPLEPNPAYPADPRTAPKSTWRCVSCHGWDYSGSDGLLGEISSKFVSMAGAKGRDPDQIAKFLRSGSHAVIAAKMPDEALHALSLFICCGQHDIRTLTGPNGEAKGDPLRGKDIYDGICNRCHQADGKAPIYGEPGDVSSLGWIARQHPAQAAHKIRNGVPSADMVSLRFLDIERIGDLLAYLQTLDAQ
jgi:cytochrome c5